MFDADRFIQCVQCHPTIWDKKCKDYSDRASREKSWSAIGEMMFEDAWNEMKDEERMDQIIEMKSKWRHIRDSFIKYINRRKSAYSATNKKKYVYADALTFLLGSGKLKQEITENSQTQDDEDEADEATQSSYEEDDATQAEGSVDTVMVQPTSSNKIYFKRPHIRKSHGINTFQQRLLRTLGNRNTVEEDPEKSFLNSLLPYLRKLNDDEKLDFRLHTLQFFRDNQRKPKTFLPNEWSD